MKPSAPAKTARVWKPVVLAYALFLVSGARGADEAERHTWTFRSAGEAMNWAGNGTQPHGTWPVRDGQLQLTGTGKQNPSIVKHELRLPAEHANVIQIQMSAGTAKTCRLFFATDVSPRLNAEKMLDFDLQPGGPDRVYTLDLKNLASWTSQVSTLRFDIVGLKEGETTSIRCIKIYDGEKISTPMQLTNYRPGQKPVVREFRAAAIFNDNMVLQRERPVPVFGRGKPGEAVTVRFAGQAKPTTADSAGKWSVTLDPLPASSEPRTMDISSSIKAHSLSFKNVVVGDVWLCGGQSNMGGSPRENAPPAERRTELLATDYPNLRYVSMPTLNRETPMSGDAIETSLDWQHVRASSVQSVSAVSYYFGQAVHSSQKIPVGLLFIIKAGSQVEQWIGQSTLRSAMTEDELQKSVTGQHLASGLHNGMVAPILPFPIRGAIWYQGESNADNEARYMGYYKTLPALIREWRALWGYELPVMIAQLPSYDGRYPADSWAFIREAQLLTSLRVPNVGLAVTFDEGDPTNLHPCNKYFIGTRLGLAARSLVYGEKIESSGPIYTKPAYKGAEMHLHFAHVGGGLKARGELTGFEVRGAEGKWVAAKAVIHAPDTVVVSCPEVAQPLAARYAWSNAPVATLFSDLGLPASPFRTDTPATSEGPKQ